MTWRACLVCHAITSGSYCGQHQPVRQRQPDERASASIRGYDHGWRKRRAAHLKREPYCRSCGEPATDVDHIVARRAGGSDDEDNLQSLCHACHSRKTVRGQ